MYLRTESLRRNLPAISGTARFDLQMTSVLSDDNNNVESFLARGFQAMVLLYRIPLAVTALGEF